MFGFTPRRAFVVDGATDLVDTPFSGAASDASWLAKRATAGLSVSDSEPDTRKVIREISNAAANEWLSKTDGADIPLWAQPSATMLVVSEIEGAIEITRRSEEHTSELQSLMRISYAVFCLKKKNININTEYMPNQTIQI